MPYRKKIDKGLNGGLPAGQKRGCEAAICLLLALLLALPVAAWAQPVSQAAIAAPDAPPAAVQSDYQLGAADKVRIIVFNEPSLSGEFFVNTAGALSLPLIGDVTARGKTLNQVAQAITDQLKGRYVLQPRVSIDVLTFRPFYILGEVNKAGEYPYSTGLTVDAAVALAGGFTYRANRKKVFVRHINDDQPERVELSPDLKVMPGDTIRIGERYW
jgi:protein involved in polysaccharide export with SLBB domain